MNLSLSKLWEMVENRDTWFAAVHGVTKHQTWLSYWTTRIPGELSARAVSFVSRWYPKLPILRSLKGRGVNTDKGKWKAVGLDRRALPLTLTFIFPLFSTVNYCPVSLMQIYLEILLLVHQFSSVTQSCLTLCEPMNCSTPGLPVHHQLPEFIQTHVYWVGDAIQPSHPLLSPSPPALKLFQHQGLFKWVISSHQVAKVLELQPQHQSLQWTPKTDLL